MRAKDFVSSSTYVQNLFLHNHFTKIKITLYIWSISKHEYFVEMQLFDFILPFHIANKSFTVSPLTAKPFKVKDGLIW